MLKDAGQLSPDFIVPELTLAATAPGMADLIPLAEASREKALQEAAAKARAAAERLPV